ncbi:MAG: hypothetical protein PSX80_07105, partial [bacterium]|nr:hypothetical protein [bacterium]
MNDITFEEVPAIQETHTIGEAFRNVWNDPGQFITNWNYKGAVLSGVMRAPIFFITYLAGRESLRLAIGAAAVQFAFRFAFAGVGGTLIQGFRRVEPAWKALLAIMLILPAISHLIEFAVQAVFAYFTSTQDHTDAAILRSITVSIMSALFTLFAMRRNVMTVGDEESRSLLHDLSRLPRLVFEFCAFIPNEIASFIRRGAWVTAIIALVSFGAFAQIMVWALVNRPNWTYGGGKSIPLIKYFGVDGMILMVIAVIISLIWFNRK